MPPDLKRLNKKFYNKHYNNNNNKSREIKFVIRWKMNRIKIHRINYYILLSILFHICLFLFIKKEKEVTLGNEIIPIEIIDNLLESGIGEALKRREIITQQDSYKEKKDQRRSDEMKIPEGRMINKKINYEEVDKNNSKNNKNQTILKKDKGSGSRVGIKNNEPQKGSLSGKGIIKVTCLNCILPTYPPIALRRGAEGKTIIKIWINKSGQVTNAELLTKSGNESIDNASLKAAKRSTFYPLKKNTTIKIEYNMKIK